MLELSTIQSIISILTPVVIVLVTYIKTWAKLETTISNLGVVVDKLSLVISALKEEQINLLQRVSKVETKVEDLEKHMERRTEK